MIGKAIGGIDNLKNILAGFEPKKILEKYSEREAVLNDIKMQLLPAQKQIRQTSRSLWPRFCGTIISAAEFMSQFDAISDFYRWVDFFNNDDRARPALPMLLSYEIDGFGFALACDFLKELGYLNFGKPDVHLKKIFVALNLTAASEDYEVLKSIVRIAKSVGVTPYNVDKVFWLIGSGNFYHDNIKVGRHRDKYIAFALRELNA